MDLGLQFQFQDGPSGNLRRREQRVPVIMNQEHNQMMHLPPTPMTPQRTTRSGKRLNPLPMTSDYMDMSHKQSKFIPDMSNPNDPLGLLTPMGLGQDTFLEYDSSPEKRRMSKRLLGMSDNELETPEKKKLALEPLGDPCLLVDTGANVSPILFPGFAPEDYSFNLDRLNPDSNVSNDNDDNESLNTPHVSPANTPLLSPLNPPTPLTPQTPMTIGMTPSYSRQLDEFEISPKSQSIKHFQSIQDRPKSSRHRPTKKDMRDGIILEIKIFNFMCYTKFVWSWHKHMNFVIGENGSGKSAIQAAVMLVLGAKASATGRANSLKKFVKMYKPSSRIDIKLSNYNGTIDPEKYGHEIVLSRTITKTGGSKIQAQNASGEWVILKKKELDLILKPLQIHVNNPLQILTQTNAMGFLKKATPSLLYQSFCDAQLITPSAEFLQQSETNTIETERSLEGKDQTRLEWVRKRKQAKDQYSKILDMETYKANSIQIECEYAWSTVIEMEESQKMQKAELDEIDTTIVEVKAEIEKSEAETEKMESGLDTEGTALKELEQEYQNLASQYDDSRRSNHTVNVENTGIKKNIKLAEDVIKKHTAELEEMQRKMDDSISNKANNYERKKQETERRIKNYNDKIDEGSKELGALKSKKSQLESELEVCQRTEYEHQHHLKGLQGALRDKETELKKIKLAQSTQYDRFGPLMKKFVQRINQTQWVSRTPTGPMGACFTVKDPQYAPMVEFILNNSLYTFFVNNSKDYHTIGQIIGEVYKKRDNRTPSICHIPIKHDAVLDLRKGKAVIDGHPTVLDVLDIKDPIVTRVLVERNQIERVLLFKSYQEACGIIKDTHKVPKTCVYGFTQDWYRITPSPNYSAKSQGPPKAKTGIIQTTKFDNTAQVESDMRGLQLEIGQGSGFYQGAQENTRSVQELLRRCEKDIKKKTDELNLWKSERWTLEQSITKAPDVATNNDLIEERKEWISSQQTELKELKKKYAANLAIIQEKNREHQEFELQITVLQSKIKSLTNEAESIKEQREKHRKNIRNCEATLKKLNSKQEALQKRYETAERNLAKKVKEAAAKGERIETTRTPQEIKSDLENRQSVYNKNVDKIKDKDRVRREWLNSEKVANEMAREIAILRDLIKLLKPLIKNQMFHLEKKKREYGLSLQNYFTTLIERRGYTGETKFDWEGEKLTYFVSPDASSDARARCNFKEGPNGENRSFDRKGLKDFNAGLSGGEGSFATLCFMVALRQTMPSPFFMMDEFDVFMDGANRKQSQDILIDQAKTQSDAQFFVFTPEQLYDLPNDEKWYRICRLPEAKKSSVNEIIPHS